MLMLSIFWVTDCSIKGTYIIHANDSISLSYHRLFFSFLGKTPKQTYYIYSFAILKLLYLLRTAPCFLSCILHEYDTSLCSIVGGISVADQAWLQASLPVSSGGLGFRSAVQLALSASAAVSLPVISVILVAFQSPSVPFQEVALDHWSATLFDVPPPSGEAAGIQRA